MRIEHARPRLRKILLLLLVIGAVAGGQTAKAFNGHLEAIVPLYPDCEGVSSELRTRLQLEESLDTGRSAKLVAKCRFDALYSDRREHDSKVIPRLEELALTVYLPHVDITMGYTRVFWGKLDQLPPVDVVNPLDYSRLFLEAERSEAKLPVPMLMVSPYFEDESRLELIVVPRFKDAVYDELNELSSPFYPVDFPVPVEKVFPSNTLSNMEYGGRFATTSAEIDWSLYFYNGFQDLPSYRLDADLDKMWAEYIQGDMYGFDCEFLLGNWVARGELAYFNNQGFLSADGTRYLLGESTVGGFGLFKRFGNHYLDFTLLRTSIDVNGMIQDKTNEVTILANVEKRFAYDLKKLRFFSLVNIEAKSFFMRVNYDCNLSENTWLTIMFGNFTGETNDLISRLNSNDYFAVKYKYNF